MFPLTVIVQNFNTLPLSSRFSPQSDSPLRKRGCSSPSITRNRPVSKTHEPHRADRCGAIEFEDREKSVGHLLEREGPRFGDSDTFRGQESVRGFRAKRAAIKHVTEQHRYDLANIVPLLTNGDRSESFQPRSHELLWIGMRPSRRRSSEVWRERRKLQTENLKS